MVVGLSGACCPVAADCSRCGWFVAVSWVVMVVGSACIGACSCCCSAAVAVRNAASSSVVTARVPSSMCLLSGLFHCREAIHAVIPVRLAHGSTIYGCWELSVGLWVYLFCSFLWVSARSFLAFSLFGSVCSAFSAFFLTRRRCPNCSFVIPLQQRATMSYGLISSILS